jgi:hypothetical protein
MMRTMLRTVFLVYVRVLLCLQGAYLGFWAWRFSPFREPHIQFRLRLGFTLFFVFLGLVPVVAALRLRQGRRWAAITAILIEALWAALAALLWYETLKDWPFDWPLFQLLTLAGVLCLAAVAGLLLRPVRAYAGLIRRRLPAADPRYDPAG